MAAEGRWPDYSNFSFTSTPMKERRGGRGRSRNPPPKLVLTQSGERNRPEIQTAPLPRSNMCRGQNDDEKETTISTFTPSEAGEMYSADVSGTDSDTESQSISTLRRKMSLKPLDTTSHGLQFTDFSNHLGISMDVDEPPSFSMASKDSDAFCVMSPDEDMYGWNAVLTRKTTRPDENSTAPYQQRRASRSKRSLLQRVFSPGGSISGEAPESPPTSFAWPKHDEL